MSNQTIKFMIPGNQENLTGNAIPYLRMTRNQFWKKEVKRYQEWQDYVRACFFDKTRKSQEFTRSLLVAKKPINIRQGAARMDIEITWANKAHADPDNIWKGIADALFVNDKRLDGSFNHKYGTRGGYVTVTINL